MRDLNIHGTLHGYAHLEHLEHVGTTQLCLNKDFRGLQISLPVTTTDIWHPDSSSYKYKTPKAPILVALEL